MDIDDTPHPTPIDPKNKFSILRRILFYTIAIICFGYLYYRLNSAALREGLSLIEYLSAVFTNVQWIYWVLLMMIYSSFYFLVDTLITTKALNWFIADIKYRDVMPIRACAYIISIFNEQVGKGSMAYYLNKRDQVPGWEVSSVMLFIMFCEMFYLLAWALLGYLLSGDGLPEVFVLIPYIALGASLFLILWISYFRSVILPNSTLRDKPLFYAFKLAKPQHYGAFFLLRSPALLIAVMVYALALGLFGVEVSYIALLGYLPVIFFAAAVPTPMRAAAITFWVILFPDREGQIAAFGLVQHNFFIFFNALIGLIFWRRAQRELFS